MRSYLLAVSLVAISGCTLSVISGVDDGGTNSASGGSTGTSIASGSTTGQSMVTASGTTGGAGQGSSTGQGSGSSGGSPGSTTGSTSTGGTAPCQFVISPTQLNFGNVAIGDTSSVFSFAFTNVGTTSCVVTAPSIRDDTSGSFSVLSTSISANPTTQEITLPAPSSGQVSSLVVSLDFAPSTTGSLSAEVAFSLPDSSEPSQTVSLIGTSNSTCLQVVPFDLTFGDVGEDGAGLFCTSPSRTFTVVDACGTAATIQSIAVQSGPGDVVAQFSAPSGPSLPDTILPYTFGDAGATFEISFNPTTIGAHSAQLLVSDGTSTSVVPLLGAAVASPTETDSFVVGPPKADILFILDVEDDAESENALLDAGPGFFQAAAEIDYRIALTTDNVIVDGGSSTVTAELGNLLPCSTCSVVGGAPTIIGPSSVPPGGTTADPAATFADLVAEVPTDGYPSTPPNNKQFFVALFDALTNDPRPGIDFFRPGVNFAVINVNDDNEDDSSQLGAGGHAASWYAAFFEGYLAGAQGFSWNYINSGTTPTGTGFTNQSLLPSNIQEMLSATGGFAVNTSDSNWGSALDSFWQTLFANVAYRLVGTPSQGQTGITVSVNGTTIDQQAGPGESNWTYDSSRNAIVFASQANPAVGSSIAVTYPIGCQ